METYEHLYEQDKKEQASTIKDVPDKPEISAMKDLLRIAEKFRQKYGLTYEDEKAFHKAAQILYNTQHKTL